MWRFAIPLLAVFAALGCDGEPNTVVAVNQSQLPQTETFAPAGFGEPSGTVGLYRQSSAVKVGNTWEQAREVFPEPTKGAYELHDLPPKFPREYEVHGWETGTGEGFGVILKNDKVLAAMYQLENTRQDTLNEFLNQQIQGAKDQPVTIANGGIHYWFWQDAHAHETLMVCSNATPTGLNLTIAMGDDEILRQIGVSQEEAKKPGGDPPNLTSPTSSNEPGERFAFSQR